MRKPDYSNFSTYKQKAFSMDMDTPVKGLIIINNGLYAFCEKSIYRIIMGTERDSQNQYLLSPNTKSKILNKGVENSLVANFFYFLEGIEQKHFGKYQAITFSKRTNIEQVKGIIFQILLNCASFEDSYIDFANSFNEQLNKLDVPEYANNFEIKAFMPNLEKKVKDIIITECGSILNKLSRLLTAFYGTSLSENIKNSIMKHDKRIDNAVRILISQNLVSENGCLATFVKEQNSKFLAKLVDIRNALEHPDHNKFIQINNFSLSPDRTYVYPNWELNLPDKYEKRGLITDIENLCKDFVDFAMVFIWKLLEESFEEYSFCEEGNVYKYTKPKI